MPNIPLTVWLGGVKANVIYQGRSGCCIGEDQIVFTVPDNAPTGCAVPLVAQINGQISNSTVMPVANGSRNCTFSDNPSLSPALVQLANGTSFAFGDIGLEKDFNNNGIGFNDTAYFDFQRVGVQPGLLPLIGAFFDSPPPGTCLVTDAAGGGEKVRHYGGQNGAGAVVALWRGGRSTVIVRRVEGVQDGLSSAGLTCGAR